jgi:O-antigen/teichoic acid export membrane protein
MIGVAYLAAVMVLFSEEILTYWISKEFAQRGGLTLRIFGAGVFLSSCGWAALTVANGGGRPDIPAKVHIIMAGLNIILCVILIPRYGINGAASAWLIEHLLDIGLLIPWINKRVAGVGSLEYFRKSSLNPLLVGSMVALILLWAGIRFVDSLMKLICLVIAGGFVYIFLNYHVSLNKEERESVMKYLVRSV